jgi:acetyltransferase
MMEQTQIFKALEGVRGRTPVDIAALEGLIVRFSQLVIEQRAVKEIDINPLLVSPDGLMALDARLVLHSREIREQDLPRPAIRPYPSLYAQPWTTKSGASVTIRPIRPEDEPLMVHFHETLSDRSVHFRYFHMMRLSERVAHERLARICFVDYDRDMVLVVEHKPSGGVPEIMAVGRLTKLHGGDTAEFALVVSDRYQGQGLGTELLRRLTQIARTEGISRIIGYILPENTAMQGICQKLGFRMAHDPEEGVLTAESSCS